MLKIKIYRNFQGGEMSLVIMLPNERTGLAALEEKLATQMLAELLKQVANTEVKVFLPKFKIETTIDLKDSLGKVYKFNVNLSRLQC